MTRHSRYDAAKRWGIFVAIAAALFASLWIAWSALDSPSFLPGINPLQRNTTVTVGLRQAPASLDIRKQSGHAVEQALLGNVYETLVQRNQDNQLEPGLASQWKVSKDALTYTLTLRRIYASRTGIGSMPPTSYGPCSSRSKDASSDRIC